MSAAAYCNKWCMSSKLPSCVHMHRNGCHFDGRGYRLEWLTHAIFYPVIAQQFHVVLVFTCDTSFLFRSVVVMAVMLEMCPAGPRKPLPCA